MCLSNSPARRYALLFLAALLPLLAEDDLKYGQPACSGQILDKKYFVICYDPEHKIPTWVGYALTKQDLAVVAAKRDGLDFRSDPEVKQTQRALNSDYAKSRYDKGHMAAAEDFTRSKAAMKATFVLTNSIPQKLTFNRGQWAKVEGAVRSLPKNHGDLWIFTGPVFIGNKPLKTIGANHVAVPTHVYKVVLCVHGDGAKEMFSILMPNIGAPKGSLADYTSSVNKIETLTGLDFFSALPPNDQNRLERTATPLPTQ